MWRKWKILAGKTKQKGQNQKETKGNQEGTNKLVNLNEKTGWQGARKYL